MSIYLDLRASYTQPQTNEYAISSNLFEEVENSIVKGGDLTASVTVSSCSLGLDLKFKIKGKAIVECDYCLDDMTIDIDNDEKLKIQFADRNEDTGDTVYITQDTTKIDLWPFIYDFITLAVPLTHVHPEGQCNKEMLEKLSKYMTTSFNEDEKN